MTSLLQSIYDLFLFLITSPWRLTVGVMQWIVDLVKEHLIDSVYQMLPEGVAEHLTNIDLQLINQYIEPVAWWIPFWTIMQIYFTALALAAGIRLVRWGLGLTPLIEG
tara:strand:- start:1915 stop:2238 length:324 start_codon:yes stop_codon:yes gene_type:complete